jgi:hypothetical protein
MTKKKTIAKTGTSKTGNSGITKVVGKIATIPLIGDWPVHVKLSNVVVSVDL